MYPYDFALLIKVYRKFLGIVFSDQLYILVGLRLGKPN